MNADDSCSPPADPAVMFNELFGQIYGRRAEIRVPYQNKFRCFLRAQRFVARGAAAIVINTDSTPALFFVRLRGVHLLTRFPVLRSCCKRSANVVISSALQLRGSLLYCICFLFSMHPATYMARWRALKPPERTAVAFSRGYVRRMVVALICI